MPWWVIASGASLVIAVLSLPQMLRLGPSGADGYPWYVTGDGDVLGGLILDQTQYLRLTDGFAGRNWAGTVVAPFSDRALAPWAAAQTGLDPLLALTLVNVVCLTAGTFALAAMASSFVRRTSAVMLTVAVWAVSFPVLWYTGKALVDAAAVGLMTVVLWAASTRRRLIGVLVLVAAIWAKETALVVLLPVLAMELTRRDVPRWRRGLDGAVWIGGTVVALASVGLLANGADVQFAPWFPASVATAQQFLAFNFGRLGGFLQYLFATAPAVVALVLWVPRWRHLERDVRDEVMPLLLGVVAGMALGAWSMVSALFDGRTAWTSLPFAALLIGRWAAGTTWEDASVHLRRLAVRCVLPAVAVVAAWILVGAAAISAWGDRSEVVADIEPELAVLGDVEDRVGWQRRSGSGSGELRAPEGARGPWLVDVRADQPVQVEIDGELMPTTPTRSGTVLVEDPEAAAQVRTDGAWTAELLDVDAAMPWEVLSPLRGNGPTVLVLTGGLNRMRTVEADFEDPDGRLRLLGRCVTEPCSDVASPGELPAGTEVVVVDADGAWQLTPFWES